MECNKALVEGLAEAKKMLGIEDDALKHVPGDNDNISSMVDDLNGIDAKIMDEVDNQTFEVINPKSKQEVMNSPPIRALEKEREFLTRAIKAARKDNPARTSRDKAKASAEKKSDDEFEQRMTNQELGI